MYIKWIRRGLVLLMVAVSAVTVFLVWDTVEARAYGGGPSGNTGNYSLVQDRFEFNGSSYLLTLQYKGSPIHANIVDWQVVGLSPGVMSASINRINGQNVFTFNSHTSRPEYSFRILATVMQANMPLASVQLAVVIHNN